MPPSRRPTYTRLCFRCGRGVVIHTANQKDPRLEIDPTTKRSSVYCRICWPQLSPHLRAAFRKDGFVTRN